MARYLVQMSVSDGHKAVSLIFNNVGIGEFLSAAMEPAACNCECLEWVYIL